MVKKIVAELNPKSGRWDVVVTAQNPDSGVVAYFNYPGNTDMEAVFDKIRKQTAE